MEVISISGGKMAVLYHEYHSDQPTLVFLHDSLGCIQMWRDFPERLAKLTKCNVLIYDRHGYGQSGQLLTAERDNDYMENEAGILNEILEKFSIQNAILFGHSDGGSIALLTAAKFPKGIVGVVTEGAHIFVEYETVNGIKEAIQLYESSDLKTKLEKYHGDKTDAMFWAWAKTWTTAKFRSWNIEKFLPSIKCPVLVIQGDQDEYGTIEQVEGIANQVSGIVSKVLLPNIKHTPHKEAPDLILKYVSEFVNKTV